MSNRSVGLTAVAVSAVMLTVLTPVIAGQAPRTAATKTSQPGRTPDGQPDMQGTWTAPGAYAENWVGSLEQGAVASGGEAAPRPAAGRGIGAAPPEWMVDGPEGRKSTWVNRAKVPQLIIDPPDGRVPLQQWATPKRKQLADANTGVGDVANMKLENFDPQTRCLPAGVPRSNYSVPYSGYQILQAPGTVMILSEWNHLYRVIRLDGRPHVGQNIRLYMGDSRGHWEGQTLVVDTTNFNDKTWLDMGGTFHSDALHVVERFTVAAPDTIQYEATIEDPKVFTKPWKLGFQFKRPEPGYQLYEYACHEGNHALANMLSVGRSLQKAAAEKK